MKTCSEGHGSTDDRDFCGVCGEPLPVGLGSKTGEDSNPEGGHASRQCPNGHAGWADQQYCGECGQRTLPRCPNGHLGQPDQKYCGACGASFAVEAPGADPTPGTLSPVTPTSQPGTDSAPLPPPPAADPPGLTERDLTRALEGEGTRRALLLVGAVVGVVVLLIWVVSQASDNSSGWSSETEELFRTVCVSSGEAFPQQCDCAVDHLQDSGVSEQEIRRGLETGQEGSAAVRAALMEAGLACGLGTP